MTRFRILSVLFLTVNTNSLSAWGSMSWFSIDFVQIFPTFARAPTGSSIGVSAVAVEELSLLRLKYVIGH